VNNFDTGEILLSTACECYDEMLRAYERKSWNMVVRRAQEVVELSLKGLLKIMGVEYPKSHDVGKIFERVCMEKGFRIEQTVLDELNRISSDLASKRGPAFYMEEIFEKQDAEKAKADAEVVLNFARSLTEILKRQFKL